MKLRLSEEQLQRQIKYFGYYQLAGGLLALCLIIVSLAGVESLSGLSLLLHATFLGLGGFAVYCGYLCLKQPFKGLQLSRISLLTQFLAFAVGGFSFRFAAGPSLSVGLDLTKELLFTANFSFAEFSLKINRDPDTLLVSVNLVALLLFLRTTLWLNEWTTRYSSTASSTPPV